MFRQEIKTKTASYSGISTIRNLCLKARRPILTQSLPVTQSIGNVVSLDSDTMLMANVVDIKEVEAPQSTMNSDRTPASEPSNFKRRLPKVAAMQREGVYTRSQSSVGSSGAHSDFGLVFGGLLATKEGSALGIVMKDK